MYKVGILSSTSDNAKALELADIFSEPIFDREVHNFALPSNLPVENGLTQKQTEDNYRLRKYLETIESYCGSVVIVFDDLRTVSSPVLVAKYIAEAMSTYVSNWNIFYLHRWYDNCIGHSSRSPVTDTNVDFVSTVIPFGGHAFIMDKVTRSSLLGSTLSTPTGWKRSFEDILVNMIIDGSKSMAITPNLFSPEITNSFDTRTTAECAPPKPKAVSSDNNSMWLLLWLAIGFAIAAVVLFFVLRR